MKSAIQTWLFQLWLPSAGEMPAIRQWDDFTQENLEKFVLDVKL